jgi:transposase
MPTDSLVAGIDLGDKSSVASVLSSAGDLVDKFSFNMDVEGLHQFSDRVPKSTRIAFEATLRAYPTFRSLKEMGYGDITVAHPKELVWIVRSKKKNDSIDSLKIARLHMVGMLPESHLLSQDEQIQRDFLLERVKLGVEISRMKNCVINYIKREGLYESLPPSTDSLSVARRHAMRSLELGYRRDLLLSTMMDRLEFLEKQCMPLDQSIRDLARTDDDVRLLMTIPGVDFYLASLLSSFIGDVGRFPNDDHLASFFGVVPVNRDSAAVKRRGRMSKDGPSTARWGLSVTADTVVKFNEPIKVYYQTVKKRTGSGKMARVATMRKLLRMIFHMLKTREHWRWEKQSLTEKKIACLGYREKEKTVAPSEVNTPSS